MAKTIDIYNYDRKLESSLKRLRNFDTTPKNRKLIEDFTNFCFASGMSKPRVVKYLSTLPRIGKWLEKDFDKATKADIERVVTIIRTGDKYTEWTKNDFNVLIKRFFKWLNGDEQYPDSVKWLKGCPNKSKLRLPGQGDLLTEDEIKILINASTHPRNKALIASLYESGTRIGELSSMRIKSVAFDEKGAVFAVHGKTGSRSIRVVSCVPYLVTWINNHPLKDDPDAPLWVNVGAINHLKHMRYGTIRSNLVKIFRKAGIKKKFNPHIFRHSRATYLANFLTEAQLKVYFGWVQGSDVAGTYVHLSGRDTDEKILEINGIVEEKRQKKDGLKPVECPRCQKMNAHSSKYCSQCSSIMDTETAMKEQQKMMREQQEVMRQQNNNSVADEVMGAMMKNPKVQKVLVEVMSELKLGDKLQELEGSEVEHGIQTKGKRGSEQLDISA